MAGVYRRARLRGAQVCAGILLATLTSAGIAAPRAQDAATSASEPPRPIPPHGRTRNVAVLVFEGVELLDFAGPVEAFTDTRRWDEPLRVYTVGPHHGPFRSNGVTIVPDFTVDDAPVPDLLVLPGGEVRSLEGDAPLARWIRAHGPNAEIVFSVCNGVFALAENGWLDGLAATTHWTAIRWLRDAAPRTEVREHVRVVDNGHIVTAAGISAGIDGALHLIARLLGSQCARDTARRMEYEWQHAPAEEDAVQDPVERGRRAWYRDDWPAVVAVYGELAAQHDDDAVVRARLGTALLFTRRVDEGLPHLERAVQLDPTDALTYDALGYAYSKLGRHREAADAYARVLALDPRREEAERGLGTAQAALGMHREAVANLRKVWDRGEGDPSMIAQIARSLAAIGERDDATLFLATFAREHPDDLAVLLAEPVFDGVRDDPRVTALAQRAGSATK